MNRSLDVLVAIPAHNEAESIAACLESVCQALAKAQRRGAVELARVAVGLHRCTDETEARARRALARHPRIEPVIVGESDPSPVGFVRTRLIEQAAILTPALSSDRTWIFSTDADTVVPRDWIYATLAQQADDPADLILGLADLDGWDAKGPARRAYRQILDAGVSQDGHHHVYAANLAIRLSAFRRVGGFPGLPHGEEHGLARAVRAAELAVLTTFAPRVRTSARMPGRAAGGLGSLLDRLAQQVPG